MATVSIRFDAVELVDIAALLGLTLIRVKAERAAAIVQVGFLLDESL